MGAFITIRPPERKSPRHDPREDGTTHALWPGAFTCLIEHRFAGGYFQAMSAHAASCPDRGGLLCITSAPAEELAYIVLATMLSVVFIYVCLPGHKWDRRLIRGGDAFDWEG